MKSPSLTHFELAPPPDRACKACDRARSSCVKLPGLRESAGSGCQECHLRYLGVLQALGGAPPRGCAEVSVWSRGRLTMVKKCWSAGPPGIDANTSVYFYTDVGEAGPAWPSVGAGRGTARRRTAYAAIVRAWLRACDESHAECRRSPPGWGVGPHAKSPVPRGPGPPRLPTRVLDVESAGPGAIKIIEVADEEGLYVALSHCWGREGISIKTTRDNFRDRQRVIPLDDLPRNFQDAVQVTKAAGLRYLWIDALCILQNDKDDWEKESGAMVEVYQNAYFVLGADMSPDAHGGFLDTEECGYERWETPVATFGPEKSTIYARYQHGLHHNPCPILPRIPSLANEKVRNPLRDRAWALQEQILASRMVHFTEKEMIWECRAALWCACGELDMGIYANYQRLSYYESLLPGSTNRFRIWYEIVNAIGFRKITRQSDLLPALSGLAQQFQRQHAGAYLAGIWEDDLPRGLLWKTDRSSGPTRADPYRAPSWSWASIRNGIGRYEHCKARLERVYATIRGAKCVPDGQDPLGAVARDKCYLKVYGPLMELVYQGQKQGCDEDGQWDAPNNACPMKPPQICDSDFDFEFKPHLGVSLYLLYIGDLPVGPPPTRCRGLILRRYNTSPHPEFEESFERIGRFGHHLGAVVKYAQLINNREVVIF